MHCTALRVRTLCNEQPATTYLTLHRLPMGRARTTSAVALDYMRQKIWKSSYLFQWLRRSVSLKLSTICSCNPWLLNLKYDRITKNFVQSPKRPNISKSCSFSGLDGHKYSFQKKHMTWPLAGTWLPGWPPYTHYILRSSRPTVWRIIWSTW